MTTFENTIIKAYKLLGEQQGAQMVKVHEMRVQLQSLMDQLNIEDNKLEEIRKEYDQAHEVVAKLGLGKEVATASAPEQEATEPETTDKEVVYVTDLEDDLLTALCEEMYAEPGFSDQTLADLVTKLTNQMKHGLRKPSSWKGVLSSLVKKNLVNVQDMSHFDMYEGNVTMFIVHVNERVWEHAGRINPLVANWSANTKVPQIAVQTK